MNLDDNDGIVMLKVPSEAHRFAEVRSLVEDLFRVKKSTYVVDFTATVVVGWLAFLCSVSLPDFRRVSYFASLGVAALAFYRSLIFIHEIAHVRSKDLAGFTVFWNLFCGFFMFLPDYTYLCHGSHHRINSFSTKNDPEYLPLSFQKPFQILSPFLVFPLLPIILAVRFLIVGPLSLIIGGRFRDWVLRYVSSLKMNLVFEWTTITVEEKRRAAVEDVLCLGWWILFLSLCVSRGYFWRVALTWIALVYFIQCINHFRSLVAHRYINFTGERVSYEAQLLDSITITDFSPAAVLFTPIGLRYHSLHHMFPTMPYHQLAIAHSRLIERLPKDHIYFKTLMPTFFSCMRQFMKIIAANRHTLAPGTI